MLFHRCWTLLIIALLLGFTGNSFSQYPYKGKENHYRNAKSYFASGNFTEALKLYQVLHEKYPLVSEYTYKMGICYLKMNFPGKAISYLEQSFSDKPNLLNVEYYLGQAYAQNHQFQQAQRYYEKAKTSNKTQEAIKKEIPALLDALYNFAKFKRDSLKLNVVNLGPFINSPHNERSPWINQSGDKMILSLSGPFCKRNLSSSSANQSNEFGNFSGDIFHSGKLKENWSEIQPFEMLNTEKDERCSFLNIQGNTLLFSRFTESNSGDIYCCEFRKEKWSKPKALPVNSKYWEGDAIISEDGKTLIFSSNRPGGQGGKDLYTAELNEKGKWVNIRNMGKSINSPYDDTCPSLDPLTGALYFSSRGYNSMGGFDIFVASKKSDESFNSPENLGYPINSDGDDLDYYISSQGICYLSSGRKGGYGQQDIYKIVPLNNLGTNGSNSKKNE